MPTFPKKEKNKIVKIIDERSPPEQMGKLQTKLTKNILGSEDDSSFYK